MGARLNIYARTPGAYVRAHRLETGLYALSTGDAVTVGVQQVKYAAEVKLGRRGGALTLQTDQAQARARGVGSAVDPYGRSGRNYGVPAGFVAGAQAFAAYRLQALFVEAVKRRAA